MFENRPVQAEAVEPAAAQALRRLASVLMVAAGEVPFAENVGPGLAPVCGPVSAAAVAKAFCRPVVLPGLAPTFPPAARNCSSA